MDYPGLSRPPSRRSLPTPQRRSSVHTLCCMEVVCMCGMHVVPRGQGPAHSVAAWLPRLALLLRLTANHAFIARVDLQLQRQPLIQTGARTTESPTGCRLQYWAAVREPVAAAVTLPQSIGGQCRCWSINFRMCDRRNIAGDVLALPVLQALPPEFVCAPTVHARSRR